MSRQSIDQVRSQALFASPLQRSQHPTAVQVRAAIGDAVCRFGSRGCAARMAQEFGDHPETAVARMRWAHQVVAAYFPASGRNEARFGIAARPGRSKGARHLAGPPQERQLRCAA